MRITDLIKMSASSLSVNKGRSALTMLGIVIGISSIIIVLSVGGSSEKLILGEIEGFGTNNVFVLPGKQPDGLMSISGTLSNDSLKVKDYEELKKKENVPDAKNVIPYAFGPVTSSYGSETYSANIIGSTPEIKEVFSIDLSSGRFFDDIETSIGSRIAIIGRDVKDELFGFEEAVGKKVKINNSVFNIIGVMSQEGSGSSPIDLDKSIISPYKSAQRDVLGIRYFQRIAVEAPSQDKIEDVRKDIEATLRVSHDISNPEDDDFFTQTQGDIANSVGRIIGILAVLVSSVAAVSLFVGGVGIMNVMFVSVTERRREIGMRKALGASNGNIFNQFLTEAVFLTFGGGVLGILFGGAFTAFSVWAVNKFGGIDFPFFISTGGMILGVSVSVVLGLIFGIFPAMSAARETPMEAITYK